MCVRVAERWVCVNIGSKGQRRRCRINTDGSAANTVSRMQDELVRVQHTRTGCDNVKKGPDKLVRLRV
jgi:hypothetical protein